MYQTYQLSFNDTILIPGVFFREDAKSGRVGMLTTNDIKHGMATLMNIMLRENRICILPEEQLVCREPREFLLRLREQMGVYSCKSRLYKTSS